MAMKHGNGMRQNNARLRAVERSYLRAAVGIPMMDGLRNKEIYMRYNAIEKRERINCRVVQWVKRNTLRYGYVRRILETRIIINVYQSNIADVSLSHVVGRRVETVQYSI